MPAKSNAQQRAMAAAERGATFPLAKKLRASMTHQQLHDFASGSERGKPQHALRRMHPTMQQRAQLVKEAHAHLGRTVAGFHQLLGRDKMQAVQAHVTRRLKGR